MRSNNWVLTLSILCALSFGAVQAQNAPNNEQVQVPLCLAEKITFKHHVLAENTQFKIIDLDFADVNTLALLADKVQCGRFVNLSHKITGNLLADKKHSAQALLDQQAIPTIKSFKSEEVVYEIKHEQEVNAALELISPENIWNTVTHLTNYHDRSAISETGLVAAYWLKTSFEGLVLEFNRTDTSTFFISTGNYTQPSLVTVIGKDRKEPAIVIGAHMDTLDGRMPGAGDDASGSSTIMETARVLFSSHLKFKRPIYIIWYAAEERGLVGSGYVVNYFKEHNIPVHAVMQFDMTGYRAHSEDPTMWVYTDYVDNKLSNFTAALIKKYIGVPVNYSKCGYGCSDHASWNAEGIPASFPCETSFKEHNPYIHSSLDTMDLLTLDHMTNFTKLAVAFAIELAMEPTA